MSIIHIQKREHPYVQIDKRCLSDNRLSWRARGVLAYLLSKPAEWLISVKELESQGLEGRDAVQNALKELQKIGYAKLETSQDELGRLLGKRWIITEEPTNGFSGNGLTADELKNRQTEKPSDGKSVHSNNEYSSNNEKEREQNEKNSPSPVGNSVSLEAEKEKNNPPVPPAPPYAGPTLVELHDAAHPDIPVFDIVPPAPVTQPPTNRIGLGDRPNAETPVQLESALREFYTDWPNEWSVGILENGRGKKYDASKQVEIVKDFCCWAVDHNRQRDTFGQLNARLQAWFRNEQHSTWKQAKPGQPGNTEKPVYERPKNAIY